MRRVDVLQLTIVGLIFLVNVFFFSLQKNKEEEYLYDYEVLTFFNAPYSKIKAQNREGELNFLKDLLKDVNIVLIGDQKHGDGSSARLKRRLVKFLFEQCNYSNIILENNSFDISCLSNQLEHGLYEADFSKAVYPFQANSKENIELHTDIENNYRVDSLFKIYGMDIIPTGSDGVYRVNELKKRIIKINPNIRGKYKSLFKNLENIGTFRWRSYSNKLTKDDKLDLLSQLKSLESEIHLEENLVSNESKNLKLFLSDLHNWIYSKWYFDLNQQRQLRDSLMAKNCVKIVEQIPSNGKTIILTANSHILYNDSLIEGNYKRLGSYLKEKYMDKVYTINITSHSGYTGSMFKPDSMKINQSSVKSIERLIHEQESDISFYDFSNNEIIKKYPISLKVLGHNNHTNKWACMMDGLFFIDNMKPIHY